jgi:hypothetical protein
VTVARVVKITPTAKLCRPLTNFLNINCRYLVIHLVKKSHLATNDIQKVCQLAAKFNSWRYARKIRPYLPPLKKYPPKNVALFIFMPQNRLLASHCAHKQSSKISS